MQWYSMIRAASSEHQRRQNWPRIFLLVLLLAAVTVGCGGERDDRDNIRAANGEPDDITYNEGPFSDYEVWTYYNFGGGGKDKEYQFQRNRNSCGADKNWILILEREITPEQSAQQMIGRPVQGESNSGNPIKP